MAEQFGYTCVHFCTFATFDLTADLTQPQKQSSIAVETGHQYVSKSIFSNKFCNKFILQSNDKDLLRCYIIQIMNVFPFVKWCDYFHELKDGTFYSTGEALLNRMFSLSTHEKNHTIERIIIPNLYTILETFLWRIWIETNWCTHLLRFWRIKRSRLKRECIRQASKLKPTWRGGKENVYLNLVVIWYLKLFRKSIYGQSYVINAKYFQLYYAI